MRGGRAQAWWLGCWLGPALSHQRGFLDLVDRLLLVAVLDPAGAAAGTGSDRVQTEADGDQGRSAQWAAWHEDLFGRLLGCGSGASRTSGGGGAGRLRPR